MRRCECLTRCSPPKDHIDSTENGDNSWSEEKGKEYFGNLRWLGASGQADNQKTRSFDATPKGELKGELWFKIQAEYEDEATEEEAKRPCMHLDVGLGQKKSRVG